MNRLADTLRPKLYRDERGVTLVEVLAAAAILAMIVIGFTRLSYLTTRVDAGIDRKSEAARIANSVLAQTREIVMSTHAAPANLEPASPVPGYRIYLQLAPIQAISYETDKFQDSSHVSVQSVVPVSDNGTLQPFLLSVTVYWEG